uniref:Uncharacterized protein n=1 Tax=Moniliophthora roreri TaxID=221103 RepID=A0A0W0F6D4_MONRR
MLYLHFLTPS